MTTKITIMGIEVDKFVTDDDLKMLEVKPNELDRMWSENPATAAYFGNLHGRSITQVGRLKTRRDLTEAQVAQELREAAIAAGDKVVETKIESGVRKDSRFVAISMAYAEAQGIEKSMEALNLASRARKDALRHFSDKATYEMHRSSGSYRARNADAE